MNDLSLNHFGTSSFKAPILFCPFPVIINFSLVSPSNPTGPRACNLSVDIPTSAPRPYSKPSANLVIAGDIFKIYFDQSVDLSLIKENLLKRQSKYEAELDVISKRLSNKSFVDRAPKNIVDQEKNNYNELQKNIDKISITVKGL